MTTFQNLNLNPKILTALENKGYINPTPIQLQAIPPLLEGKDILGIAQTGTGKTAAFSLPILHNLALSNNPVKSGGVRALILTPTRELASQIAENIELYGKDLHLRHAVIFGGVSERPQIATMQRGVDILIATPGRLLDLASQGYIRFMNLEILVLDEADRMLDMGFINDIKKIIAKIPEKRQTLFFSATMPDSISDLAHSILKKPVKVEITPQATTVERIDQKINFVAKGNKLSLLKRILKQDDVSTVLVFSKTKHGANRVVEFLEKNGISVAAIHGNKSQGAREKALASFRDGKVQVLIATDIAARGIDVPSISHVINFDIPMDPESYVHRIGRTARAGKEGIAISFCDPSERKLLQAVEKTIRFKIPVDETHPYHGVEAAPSSHEDNDRPRSPRPGSRKPASSSRGGSSERRSAPSSERRAPSSDRRSAPSSDRRSSAPRGRDDRRPAQSEQPDGRKSGLLDFIGFGKKTPALTSGERGGRPSPTRSDDAYRVPGVVEEKGSFGFGWLKSGAKKSDSRGGFGGRERSPSRERPSAGPRDDSFGNRERPAREGSSRGGFGGGERSSGSRGGFGGGERSGASRGGFGSGERSSGSRGGFGGGERSGASRGGFGGGERSSGSRSGGFGERSGGSSRGGFGERSSSPRGDSFGNSERPARASREGGSSFGERRSNTDRKPFNRSSGAGRPAPRKTW